MLVKIKPDLFINPDHVAAIQLTDCGATVMLTQGHLHTDPASSVLDAYWLTAIDISIEAAYFLMQQMDTASAPFPGEPGYIDPNAPSTQPLTSQIAILLRDEFPQGATIGLLMGILHLDYHLIYEALDSLIAERVVQFDPLDNGALYFHASHAPKEYVTEPEREIDLLSIAPFQSALRDGEFQCVECKAQSCATCITAQACCKCKCPNFTLRKPDPIAESRKELLAFLEVKFPGATDSVLLALDKSAEALEQTITFLRAIDYKVDYGYVYDCKHLEQLEKLLQAIKLIMPNPDPLTEDAAQASNPGEDTGSTKDQTTERLCPKCDSPLTSQSHLNNCDYVSGWE